MAAEPHVKAGTSPVGSVSAACLWPLAACSATLLDLVILRVCDHGCTTTRRWASSSGFVTEYEDDVTFATVHGAGHMSGSASVATGGCVQRFGAAALPCIQTAVRREGTFEAFLQPAAAARQPSRTRPCTHHPALRSPSSAKAARQRSLPRLTSSPRRIKWRWGGGPTSCFSSFKTAWGQTASHRNSSTTRTGWGGPRSSTRYSWARTAASQHCCAAALAFLPRMPMVERRFAGRRTSGNPRCCNK